MAASLLLYDVRWGRLFHPCLVVVLGVLLAMHLAWDCRMMVGWQAFGKMFAALFF